MKTVWTLALPNYPTEMTDLTFPWIKHYAKKIGAEFRIIDQRRFPQWGPTYEKHQIWELGARNEWNIFIDADAIIHPNLFDVTSVCPPQYVMFTGKDMSNQRFRADHYFKRDIITDKTDPRCGLPRFIGACSWFVVSSYMTHDLWMPCVDLTPEQCYAMIWPTLEERECVNNIMPPKLIEDFTLSRNIARFGLKHMTIEYDIKPLYGRAADIYYWHQYKVSIDQKVEEAKKILEKWGMTDPENIRPEHTTEKVRHISLVDGVRGVDGCAG